LKQSRTGGQTEVKHLLKLVTIKDIHTSHIYTCSCSGAVHHRQGPTFTLGHSPCLHTRTMDTADICSPSLPYNGLHSSYSMDYYSFTNPGGMERWVGV